MQSPRQNEDGGTPFLDVSVKKKVTSLKTVYTKPMHIGQYQLFESNHPPHVKKGIIQNRCKGRICYNRQNNLPKLDLIKTDLLSDTRKKVTESVIDKKLPT